MTDSHFDDGEGSLNGFKYDGHLVEDVERTGADGTVRQYVLVTRPDGFQFYLRSSQLAAQLSIALSHDLIPRHVVDVIQATNRGR